MPTSRRLLVGIDPGLSGALAYIDAESGVLLDLADMPTTAESGRRVVDARELCASVSQYAGALSLAAVEHVHSMPGQGVRSVFSFGRSYGTVLAAIAPHCRIVDVPPQVWKRHFGLIGKPKSASRELAAKKFPNWAQWFARVKDDGRAEAALIAAYALGRGYQ
jgi:crossover junction endodeoxyribonuclease RuvC